MESVYQIVVNRNTRTQGGSVNNVIIVVWIVQNQNLFVLSVIPLIKQQLLKLVLVVNVLKIIILPPIEYVITVFIFAKDVPVPIIINVQNAKKIS